MRIVILGAPGSGKRTQAKLLAAHYRVLCISVDDLLRKAAADGRLEARAGAAPEAGEAVADEVLMDLLEERLRARDSKRGFIIDDFPRNIPQAQALDARLGMLGGGLHIAIHVTVGDATLARRITGRLVCEQCGAVYNRHTAPPATRGKCDACGGRVVSGNGDDARSAALKIKAHHEQIPSLRAYYKAQHKLRTVAAEGGVEEIREKICEILDLEIRPLEVKTLETAAQSSDEEVSTVIAGGQINRVIASPPPDAPANSAPPARPGAAKPAPVKKKPAGGGKGTPQKAAGKSTSKPAKKQAARKTAKKPAAKKPPSKKPVVRKAAKKPAGKKRAAATVRAVKKVAKQTAKKIIQKAAEKVAKKPAKKPTKKK